MTPTRSDFTGIPNPVIAASRECGVDPRAFWKSMRAAAVEQRSGTVGGAGNWSDLQVQAIPPLSYLIDPLVPIGALVALSGPTGSAKTFQAIALAFTVAVAGGRVLFLALEGLAVHGSRIAAWKKSNGIPVDKAVPEMQYRPPGYRLNLQDAVQVTELCSHIRSTGPYALVVIDNLNECLPGDDNDPKVMGPAMNALRQVQGAVGPKGSVAVVDNFGYGARRLKGNRRKEDTFDTVIYMEGVRDDGSLIDAEDDEPLERVRVRCGKERNGPRFKRFFLKFEKVGDSGVLVPMGAPKDPVLTCMKLGQRYSRAELVLLSGKSRATVGRRLAYWVEQEEVFVEGAGQATKYYRQEVVIEWDDAPEGAENGQSIGSHLLSRSDKTAGQVGSPTYLPKEGENEPKPLRVVPPTDSDFNGNGQKS